MDLIRYIRLFLQELSRIQAESSDKRNRHSFLSASGSTGCAGIVPARAISFTRLGVIFKNAAASSAAT